MINDVVRDGGGGGGSKKKGSARERIEGGKCESVDMVTRRYERSNPARKKYVGKERSENYASFGNFYIEHIALSCNMCQIFARQISQNEKNKMCIKICSKKRFIL